MKVVTIRLYRQHDMDLISLYMNDAFDFAKEMKNAVAAMVANKPYTIEVPEYKAERIYLRRMYLVHIYLHTEDAEIRKKLNEIRVGQICSFFKAAMRACLSSFPYGAYFGGDGFTMSKAEETKLVNKERQKKYEDNKKKKTEAKPKKEAEVKPAEKKPKKAVTVQFNDDVLLPEPIPFENIPIPEPEGEYDGPIDDDEGMALFDAINKVTGS